MEYSGQFWHHLIYLLRCLFDVSNKKRRHQTTKTELEMFASSIKKSWVSLLWKSLIYFILKVKPSLPPPGRTIATLSVTTAIPKSGFLDKPDVAIRLEIPIVPCTVNLYLNKCINNDVKIVSSIQCLITCHVIKRPASFNQKEPMKATPFSGVIHKT